MAAPDTFSRGRVDLSLAATISTDSLSLGQKRNWAVQFITNPDATTGEGAALSDAVGTFAAEVSNDKVNWVTQSFVDDTGTTVSSFALTDFVSNTFMVDLSPVNAAHLRFTYTRTSGGASDECRIMAVGKKD